MAENKGESWPCDFDTMDKVTWLSWIGFMTGKPYVKIGMELFYAEGPADRAGDQSAGDTGSSWI